MHGSLEIKTNAKYYRRSFSGFMTRVMASVVEPMDLAGVYHRRSVATASKVIAHVLAVLYYGTSECIFRT